MGSYIAVAALTVISLQSVHSDDIRYEPNSVSIYLAAACKTLSYLIEDSETLEKVSDGISGKVNASFDNFENLFEEFIKPDHALMVAAGMDEKMANYFFRDVEELFCFYLDFHLPLSYSVSYIALDQGSR